MRLFVGLVFAAAFGAALVYTALSQSAVECEVCMQFGGRGTCRTVAAADRDQAVAMAISNACALLTSGVTPGIQCGQTPPRSVTCND